jgi:hypothetical protein
MRRLANILLLAAFCYWTSGLGQCLHEKYEHWHPDPETLKPAKNGAKPLQEADDHDDCLTCQTLKAMKARTPDAPKTPEPSLPSIEKTYLPHRRVAVLFYIVFIPARAPPARLPTGI